MRATIAPLEAGDARRPSTDTVLGTRAALGLGACELVPARPECDSVGRITVDRVRQFMLSRLWFDAWRVVRDADGVDGDAVVQAIRWPTYPSAREDAMATLGSIDGAAGDYQYARFQRADREGCCPHCGGGARVEDGEPVLKRGAIVVAYDPTIVTWRGRIVPLSPTEAHVYAHLARRGRATIAEIDEELQAFGSNPATRSLVLGHIRGKFRKMGACDPFERIGAHAFRLRVDPDENGLAAPVIGLKLPRYATASSSAAPALRSGGASALSQAIMIGTASHP